MERLGENQMKESAKEEKEAIEVSRSDAWFAVKLGLGMLAIHYALGTVAAIAFAAGWLWGNWRGARDSEDPPDDVKLDDLL